MSKELVERIKESIADDEKGGDGPDYASWGMQCGVLLTANEAKQCLAALEGRELARSVLIDQAKETCYRHRLPEMGSKLARQYAIFNWPHYLTPKASQFLG